MQIYIFILDSSVHPKKLHNISFISFILNFIFAQNRLQNKIEIMSVNERVVYRLTVFRTGAEVLSELTGANFRPNII